jgi:ribose transport system ATP-binding protein
MEQYTVEMLNIDKDFGGIRALKNVTMQVKKGTVHALVGENGAGKSTLMKILSGACKKDSGEIRLEGKTMNISNSHEGRKAGIGIIYQEFALAPDMTVAENIFMGEDISGKQPFVKWKELYTKANGLLKSVGFEINPKQKVKDLSVAYQQMTEIAKALTQNVKVLVLDEPTAVLGPIEAEKLFKVIQSLKEKGVSIIYISHRLEEIFRISDCISVLKDGQMIGTKETSTTNINEVISMMIGREMGEMFPEKKNSIGLPLLEVKNLRRENVVKDVSFTVHAGEVLGIAGLVGAGKTETMRLVFGADRRSGGEIQLGGKKLRIASPIQAVKAGISYVPENRKEHGVVIKMSTKVNVTLAGLSEYTGPFSVIKKKKEIEKVWELIKKLEIKVPGPETTVESLSGGNQQKVSLAKWISLNSKVIILDEPTRGVDVGAKAEIYKIVQELARQGIGIVFISSEMLEIIGMSDRVLVMHEGKISGELTRSELTEENIMKMAVGQIG